jgi:hypothetical protein
MSIRVNGKDMKDAVIKTDNYEMRILELTPDLLRVNIKETYGESFNFVPRFITVVYPDSRVVAAKDSGIAVVPAKGSVETTVQFAEKLRLEMLMTFELRYSKKKLAEISIE